MSSIYTASFIGPRKEWAHGGILSSKHLPPGNQTSKPNPRALDKCPSTVSTLRSLVPRRFPSATSASTRDDDSTTLIAGLEPYIRTSITDRIHDGIYDTDTAHKSTLGGRVKRGEIRSPDIYRHGKRFSEALAGPGRRQVLLQTS